MKSLAALLSPARIRALAGSAALKRGQDYFSRGHVRSVIGTPTGVRAVVYGHHIYTVDLDAVQGELEYDCTCPMGEEGDFCKHCVAAALSFLRNPPSEQPSPLEGLRPLLEAETPARLAALILEWAADDAVLQQNLTRYKVNSCLPDAGIAAARLAFEIAARPRHFIGYRDAPALLRKLDGAVDTFEDLLGNGHAVQVLDLCESALLTLTHTFEMIEDDGGLTDLAERLTGLHLAACRATPHDPVQLATRLFRLETHPAIIGFEGAAETYKDQLGPIGLTTYRDLAESSTFTRSTDRDLILESVARASGRIEDKIAVLARDLSYPYRFSLIIEACVAAAGHPLALTWAERGHKLYPADTSLREALASQYHHAGRHQDALQLIWKSYTESPGLPMYQALERHATLANDWPEYRDNALGLIRRRIASSNTRQDHSALVEILLAEGNVDEAWREAHAGGCSSYLWLTLAEKREKSHPGDAAPIYIQRADQELARVSNGNYETPVALLIRAAKILRGIDALPQFRRHLTTLRQLHKSKRKFIKLLDQHHASLEFPHDTSSANDS